MDATKCENCGKYFEGGVEMWLKGNEKPVKEGGWAKEFEADFCRECASKVKKVLKQFNVQFI